VALSEQLRAEVAPRGVRVSVVCPSFFRTNLCDTGIGNPATMKLALHLMDTAPDTVDSVADRVYAQAQAGRFLIIPTRDEPMRWRIKRWLPGFYYWLLKRKFASLATPR
jgi:short-subunit dehydrogenase